MLGSHGLFRGSGRSAPSSYRQGRVRNTGAQCIYTWRKQQLIDHGQVPGITSTDHAELVTARKRIAELEDELAIHRRATVLLGDVVPPKDGTGASR